MCPWGHTTQTWLLLGTQRVSYPAHLAAGFTLCCSCFSAGFNRVTPASTAQVKSYLFDSSGLISHAQITQSDHRKGLVLTSEAFLCCVLLYCFLGTFTPTPGKCCSWGCSIFDSASLKHRGWKAKLCISMDILHCQGQIFHHQICHGQSPAAFRVLEVIWTNSLGERSGKMWLYVYFVIFSLRSLLSMIILG